MKDKLINSEVLIKSLAEGPAWHENKFSVWLKGAPGGATFLADHPHWTLVFQSSIGGEVRRQETQECTSQMKGFNHQGRISAFSRHLRCLNVEK